MMRIGSRAGISTAKGNTLVSLDAEVVGREWRVSIPPRQETHLVCRSLSAVQFRMPAMLGVPCLSGNEDRPQSPSKWKSGGAAPIRCILGMMREKLPIRFGAAACGKRSRLQGLHTLTTKPVRLGPAPIQALPGTTCAVPGGINVRLPR